MPGGQGPAPKPDSRRARHGQTAKQAALPVTTLPFVPGEQPELPDSIDWHPQTRIWWRHWGESAQAENFTVSDWDFLLETALMHHQLWAKGNWTMAAELRLRVAKFGATPEDRARLRMVFADADKKESQRKPGEPAPAAPPSPSKGRYGPLKAVE